jgi:Mrp family chromosome partitioning ATPase
MSTSFQSLDLEQAAEWQELRPEMVEPRRAGEWNPETFAREQIRGLVQRVFFSHSDRPARQVVLSAVEGETDIRQICRRIAAALAEETLKSVAVVSAGPQLLQNVAARESAVESQNWDASVPPLRRIATQLRENLWQVPPAGRNPATAASLHSYLGELRREFEYSIAEAPPAGGSNEATAMAQFADGIILVVSAQRTRRSAALKIKESFEAAKVRLLGTVLSDRVFPIPEKIYRRL